MKKKLEAELISIAHRILKLKNRADLDQLQQETLKLYEKLSVLRFVEDNFNDVKPTIGQASAEEKLEEIYGIEQIDPVHANEQEAREDEKKALAKSQKAKEEQSKAEKEAEAASQKPQAKEEPKAEEEAKDKEEQPETEEQPTADKPEGDADPEQEVEEYQASEEEKEHTEEETDEEVEEENPKAEKEPQGTSEKPQVEEEEKSENGEREQPETKNLKPETEEEPATESQPETEEPKTENKIEIIKPAEDVKAMEASAAAVYDKEDESTLEEEEQAADAEVITIAPDDKAKVEDTGLGFGFAFERTAAPEEPAKQKEITFEDYRDYKEPEFIKKDDPQSISREFLPKEPEVAQKQEENANAFSEAKAEEPVRDWRDWEPAKSQEPQTTSQLPQADKSVTNDTQQTTNLRTINLGLNDRIAFEKNLFGGSGEDLNRVLSQLNTMDRFDDAQNFINDLVKPDYNNWQGKEEYEERFMQLVEKRFS